MTAFPHQVVMASVPLWVVLPFQDENNNPMAEPMMINKGVRVSTSPPDRVSDMNSVRTPRSSPSPNKVLNSRRLNPTLSSSWGLIYSLRFPKASSTSLNATSSSPNISVLLSQATSARWIITRRNSSRNGTKSSFFIHRLGQCLIAFSARASTYSLHLAGSFISRSILRMTSSSSASRAFIDGRLRATSLKSLTGAA